MIMFQTAMTAMTQTLTIGTKTAWMGWTTIKNDGGSGAMTESERILLLEKAIREIYLVLASMPEV